MADHFHLICGEDRRLLEALCGRTIKSVEGYRYDLEPSAEKTTFYAVARFSLEDRVSYDLRVSPTRVDIADGLWDDVGVLSFGVAEGEIWLPEGIEGFTLSIDRKIDGVLLVNDYDELMHGGEKRGKFEFTKAVLLQTGLEFIAFAIDDFCEDAIVVRRGFDPAELVSDCSESWLDESGWTDEHFRKLEHL